MHIEEVKSFFSLIKNKMGRELVGLVSVFLVILILVRYKLLDPIFSGFYPFGYSREVLIPSNLIMLIVVLSVMFLLIFVIIIFLDLELLEKFYSWRHSNKVMALIVAVLFSILYLYNVDGGHVALMDSYELLAGAIQISRGEEYSFLHKAAYGGSLALIPAVLISLDEFVAQLFIILYALLSYIVGAFIWRSIRLESKYEDKYMWLFLILLIVNPMFVAISRTISYEPILLFELSLLILVMTRILNEKYLETSRIIVLYLLLGMLLALIVSMRVNYIIVIGGPIAFTMLKYYFDKLLVKKKIKLFVSHILLAGAVGVLVFLYSRTLVPTWIGRDSGSGMLSILFNIDNFARVIWSSTYIILSFMNAPPARRLFPFMLAALLKASIVNIIVGLLFLSVAYKGWRILYANENTKYISLMLALLVLFDWLFYSMFGGFQARYLVIAIFILTFFFVKGLMVIIANQVNTHPSARKLLIRIPTLDLKLSKRRKMIIILFLMFVAYNSAITVSYWRYPIVKSDNTANTTHADIEEMFRMIDGYGKYPKIIFTTLEALVEFYKYKMHLKIEIFYVYKYFIINGLTPETFENLVNTIRDYLNRGYTVFYLAGWPEIDGYSFLTPHANYKDYYNFMKRIFDYTFLRAGPIGTRASRYFIGPEYELLVLNQYIGP